MKPELLAGLSDSEKAYFTSGGQVDPVTGKNVEEEASEPVSEGVPAGTEGKPEDGSAESGNDKGGNQESGSEAEEEEGDESEVAEETTADGRPKRKVIDFGAYDKKRVEAKAYKQELEQTRQQLAYLTGLMQQGRQAPQAPAQAAQPQGPVAAPDPQKEPQKWLDWVNTTLTAAQQAQAQSQQQTVQQQQVNALNAAAYQAEQEFVNGDGAEIEPHPDYYDAIKFLDGARRTELKLAGYEPEAVQQIIDAQNKDIAMRALNRGDNAASKFYALAKSRGFKAPAAAQARNAAGQFAKTEAEKVAEQAAKQKTNKSIAGLAGSGTTDKLSLESLANTPTDQIAKMLKKGDLQEVLGMS